MGAQRAAWATAFTAEAAALGLDEHALSLLDLVKAFETVPHDMLVAAAKLRGYPLRLLRLSLEAYRLQRVVGVDGAFSKRIRATRGITAGSGFATAELKLLLLDLVVLLHARWPRVLVVKLYVDDLTLAACGAPALVIKVLAEAVAFALHFFEDTLRMQVSGKKSRVIAGRPSIAAAIVEHFDSGRLGSAMRGRMLGTDHSGGRARCTTAFQHRLANFVATMPRMAHLRKLGADTAGMARAAATPAVMYGCETFGLSDSALQAARGKVAKAATPDGSGRNPDLALLALDGDVGTLDPAFDAHVGPIAHWARAAWCGWFSATEMAETFNSAMVKLGDANGSVWSVVAGPVTAFIASTWRLGWTFDGPWRLRTDSGGVIDVRVDSPAAVVTQVRDGVRRWRWRLADAALPGLIPAAPDTGGDVAAPTDMLVGCLSGLTRMLRGKACPRAAGPVRELWDRTLRADLASAVSGGQWPQARKAAVPSFGITDPNCQLCHAHPGTMAHRFVCGATRPAGGWPEPPPVANMVRTAIGAERRRILDERALLVLRIPSRPHDDDGRFRWLVDPTARPRADEGVWYFDGSMLQGRWRAIRVTGMGVVVATPDGQLLGYGVGRPPSWVGTAAAAEAWALAVLLRMCPTTPPLRTDCLALVQTARGGLDAATHHSRPLARIWRQIAHTLDGDIGQLVSSGALVWFPAHLTWRAVGEVKGSNGARMGPVDWRANRLADRLAKAVARDAQWSKHTVRLCESSDAATAHAAALLGVVTRAANAHQRDVPEEGGGTRTVTMRDSVSKPREVADGQRSRRQAAGEAAAAAAVAQPPARSVTAAPWRPPSSANSRRAAERANTWRRVREVGDGLRASSAPPAAGRVAGVAARVRARLGLG